MQKMDAFSEFQLKEYENISQAHFKTNESISSFYRYYLIVMAIPITTMAFAIANFSSSSFTEGFIYLGRVAFSIIFILIGLFGIGVSLYIEGQRLDAVLYARVVNSIRQHFFSVPIRGEYTMSPVLPLQTDRPSYDLSASHLFIFSSSAIFNSVYISSGIFIFFNDIFDGNSVVNSIEERWVAHVLIVAFLFLVHFWFHYSLVRRKDEFQRKTSEEWKKHGAT